MYLFIYFTETKESDRHIWRAQTYKYFEHVVFPSFWLCEAGRWKDEKEKTLPKKLLKKQNAHSCHTQHEGASGAASLTEFLIHLKSLSLLAKVHGVKVQREALWTVNWDLSRGSSHCCSEALWIHNKLVLVWINRETCEHVFHLTFHLLLLVLCRSDTSMKDV